MSHVELLKIHELKATPQRLCVLDILDTFGHVTLDEIQKETKEKFPTLSLSTIYRNLNEMLKKDVISEVKILNQKDRYEIAKDKHVHLVCTKCGNIEDFYINNTQLIKEVESLSENKVLNSTISFDVICKKCQ